LSRQQKLPVDNVGIMPYSESSAQKIAHDHSQPGGQSFLPKPTASLNQFAVPETPHASVLSEVPIYDFVHAYLI
jgi:hypothetical protein